MNTGTDTVLVKPCHGVMLMLRTAKKIEGVRLNTQI